MHHWADPAAGLVEIGRILPPDGRALVWDLRPGVVRFIRGRLTRRPRPWTGLRVVNATPWRWPFRFASPSGASWSLQH